VLRHYALFSYAWDLGIFNQTFWSTVNGRFFYYTVEPWFGESFFAVHFSPILIFVVPFYAVYPHPETLLVLQSFVIALGIVPLYFLAKAKLSERWAFLLSASYLMNPLVVGANFYDFHFEAFIPITLFSTIYFLEKGNLKLYTFSLLLSLMVHEYMAVFTILLMVYEMAKRMKSKEALRKIAVYAILTISLSTLWFLSASAIHSHLRKPETESMSIISPLLGDVGNPVALFSNLGYDLPQKLLYVIMLLAPLLFASLLSSHIFLSIPWLLFTFLLNYRPYYTLSYQYSLLILPFVYVSSIHGIKKIHSSALKSINLGRILVLSTFAFFVLSLTLVQPQLFNLKRADSAHDVIQLIPENASVLATNTLFPHVSSRFEAWVLPFGYEEPYPNYYTGISEVWKDYAHRILNERDTEFVLLDLRAENVRNLKLTVSELLSKKDYGLYAYADGILLLKRDYIDEPLVFAPLESTFSYATLTLHDGSRIPDNSSESGQVLAHTTKDFDNATFWSSPDYAVPQGRYSVSFRVKLTGAVDNGDVITLAVTTDGIIASPTILNSTILHADDLEPGIWETVKLEFQMELPGIIELSGLQVSNAVNLYLDNIRIVQLGYEVG
jgi:uncharacterized membrane protein